MSCVYARASDCPTVGCPEHHGRSQYAIGEEEGTWRARRLLLGRIYALQQRLVGRCSMNHRTFQHTGDLQAQARVEAYQNALNDLYETFQVEPADFFIDEEHFIQRNITER